MVSGIVHRTSTTEPDDPASDISANAWVETHSLDGGTSFPESPTEKDLYYRTDLHKWYVYNGSAWKELTAMILDPVDFWSDVDDVIALTTTAGDVNLPSIVVPTLPTGATIWKVVLLFKCSLIRDSSGVDNAILAACAIRVKKSTGTWGVDDIVAYDIPADMWQVDVSTSPDRGGDALVGNLGNDDLSSEVDEGNATYNLRFEDIDVDGNNLELHEVAVGLRFYLQ